MVNEELGARRRILLVEDEPGLQEALALTLELEGFDVIRVSDGREALACLAQKPELILTDYMMPRMNGVELIREVRATPDNGELPIILMSAALPAKAERNTADIFLQKPITITRLLNAISALLAPT